MESKGADTEKTNWSEKVDHLLVSGDTNSVISYLETLISDLQTLNSPNSQSQLVSALRQLSKLYSSIGFSLKSDQLSSQAKSLQLRSLSSSDASRCDGSSSTRDNECDKVEFGAESSRSNAGPLESLDDDWEAMVDRAPDELLSVSPKIPLEPDVFKLSLSDDTKPKVPKRRGRGTFTYRKQGLYSDQQADDCAGYESPNETGHEIPEKAPETKNSTHGTRRHVLVLDGFDPRTTTTDVEKLYKDYRDRGFAIRWVNDTLALAVFQTPSVDLDPPRQRSKTSARTAQRLIAQELGVKLPSTFGSKELRSREDARRNRIVTRQNLRDEAWGSDDTNAYVTINELKESKDGGKIRNKFY